MFMIPKTQFTHHQGLKQFDPFVKYSSIKNESVLDVQDRRSTCVNSQTLCLIA